MSFSASVSDLVAAASGSPLLTIAAWWRRVPLGEIASILNGFPWKSDYFNDSIGPFVIRIRDITAGACETRYSGPIEHGYWIEPGDLLIGMDGDFNLALWAGDRGLLNQRVCKIDADDQFFNTQFLSYVLPEYLTLINDHTHSVTVKHLSSKTVAEIPLPLPPLPEQRRIVAKLDTLSARSKRARAELDRLFKLIDRTKDAIFETAFARPQGPTVRLGDLVDEGPSNGWSPKSGRDAEGALSLKLTATTSGHMRLDDNATKRLFETPLPSSPYWLRPGDLLIQRSNTIEYVGVSAIFDGPHNTYIYPDLMMRVRIKNPVLRVFVWRFLSAPGTRAYLRGRATGTAGNMPKINGATVRQLAIPVISELEMEKINTQIEFSVSKLNRIASEARAAAALLDRLDQAILAKAFRGELVPQDPEDEPAAVLLDRIRAGRAAAPAPTRRRRDAGAAAAL